MKYFLATYGNINYGDLEREFTTTPVDMFGRKDKFYRAIVCFAKFLDRHQSLPEADFLAKAKAIQNKRHKPPKRHTLTQDQLHVLYAEADSNQNVLLLKLLAPAEVIELLKAHVAKRTLVPVTHFSQKVFFEPLWTTVAARRPPESRAPYWPARRYSRLPSPL